MADYVSLAALALALASFLFRSPKEAASEMQQRIATLEGRFSALSTDYAGIHGRHDQALSTLTAAITKLTDRFDAYMEKNGHGRTGR